MAWKYNPFTGKLDIVMKSLWKRIGTVLNPKTTGDKIGFDTGTYIEKDSNGNMAFTDTITGTRTLKNIGCPVYHFVKATAQAEGDLHLLNATNWNINKAVIKVIRVKTTSTNWDLYLLQNGNGYSVDNANIPKLLVMKAGNGNANIFLDYPYQDEDATKKVHLYFIDNIGTATADIYILATELI